MIYFSGKGSLDILVDHVLVHGIYMHSAISDFVEGATVEPSDICDNHY